MTFESFLDEVEESVDMHQLSDELSEGTQGADAFTIVPVTCAKTASLGGVC